MTREFSVSVVVFQKKKTIQCLRFLSGCRKKEMDGAGGWITRWHVHSGLHFISLSFRFKHSSALSDEKRGMLAIRNTIDKVGFCRYKRRIGATSREAVLRMHGGVPEGDTIRRDRAYVPAWRSFQQIARCAISERCDGYELLWTWHRFLFVIT